MELEEGKNAEFWKVLTNKKNGILLENRQLNTCNKSEHRRSVGCITVPI